MQSVQPSDQHLCNFLHRFCIDSTQILHSQYIVPAQLPHSSGHCKVSYHHPPSMQHLCNIYATSMQLSAQLLVNSATVSTCFYNSYYTLVPLQVPFCKPSPLSYQLYIQNHNPSSPSHLGHTPSTSLPYVAPPRSCQRFQNFKRQPPGSPRALC